MRTEFIEALKANQAAFSIELDEPQTERLADFYEIVLEHNPLLHLVGPCTPEDFAVRHILESLLLLNYLPNKARFADVGTGAGLPAIPCLLVREDLSAMLIDSKVRKATYLDICVKQLGLEQRTKVVNKAFNDVDLGNCVSVVCRAIDKFSERLPRLILWRRQRQMILFGGPNLRTALETQRVVFSEKLIPMSEQRYLFDVNR